ncbi:MAG: hypothetical protein ABIS45_13425 [Burkholderiales bacterium]
MRMLLTIALCAAWLGMAHAATPCAPATEMRKSDVPVLDWYDNYIRPYQMAEAATARPAKAQVEGFIERIGEFHRRGVLDQTIFEELISKIMSRYARAADFKGIDTAAAAQIYQGGIGQPLDFSLLCIAPKSLRTPDDAFAITLFGVVADDCQHIGLRGLVFTATLVNGGANGQCRPDLIFSRLVILPLNAGINEITFICGKDAGGCVRY